MMMLGSVAAAAAAVSDAAPSGGQRQRRGFQASHRLEPARLRILHQMQYASEQIGTQSGTRDVNDAAAREILDDHVAHSSARVVVEAVQHLIDEEPGRRVHDGPRKYQTLLLSVAQDTVPASGLIEHRHQAL